MAPTTHNTNIDIDKTANLLSAVEEATAAIAVAEKARILAVQAAKNSGQFTVEKIAEAAGITRDGVYKMLNHSDFAETFEAAFAEMRRNSLAVGQALADTLAQLKADAETSGHALGQWFADRSK